MIRYLSALLLLLPSVSSSAQVKLHSRDELLAFADANSAEARLAAVQPQVARQDLRMQSSGLYPKLSAFASGDYYPIIPTQVIPAEVFGGAPGTYLKAQFGLPYVFMAGAELSMPVVNLEKWTQLAKARAQLRQVEWSSRVAREQLHLQLIQAYYQYLAARSVQRLNDQNLETAEELMRIMEDRRAAGVVNPADFNRAQALYLDIQSAVVNYQDLALHRLNALRALLSLPEAVTLEIHDSLASFGWEVPDTEAGGPARPGYQEAAARTEVAELALLESRRAALPRLQLNGRYAWNMQTKPDNVGDGVSFDVGQIGLKLDLPLFQGNYYRSGRRKQEWLLEAAKADQERVAARLDREYRDWQIQYRGAWKRREILEQKLAAVRDNIRIARLSLAEGVMEFEEFNNLFQEYNRARIEWVQNQSDGILYWLLSTQNF